MKLVLLSDLSLQKPNSSDILTEFRLFQYGSNPAYHMGDIDVVFTQRDAEKIMAAYSRAGIDLMVDYDHQSLDGTSNQKPAAGWAKLYLKEDGLYASVEWTPKAKAMLESKEYKYFSPAVEYDKDEDCDCEDDEEDCECEYKMVRMLPIALTNTPALYNIQALVNSSSGKYTNTRSIDKNALIKKDGSKMAEETKEKTEKELAELQAHVETLKAQRLEMEIGLALDKATAEGRLAPAKRAEFSAIGKELGTKALTLMLSQLPVAVKQNTNAVVEKVEEPSAPTIQLSEFEQQICENRGYDPEMFIKEKKKVMAQFKSHRGNGKSTLFSVNNKNAKKLATQKYGVVIDEGK